MSEDLDSILSLLAAFVLALPIGWEREAKDRSLGMRTFPLISIASCAFMVIAQHAAPTSSGEWMKVLDGVATGVGFIGAGAIVKHGVAVLGTATAAGVWLTAALGAAAAFHEWAIAIALSVLGFATLTLLRKPAGSQDRGDVMTTAAPQPPPASGSVDQA